MPATTALQWANDSQGMAFAWGPTPVCGSGGWGSSKTFAFCLKALYLSDIFPGNRGVIFRKVGKELRATTMATFRKLCPESAYRQWNQQEGLLTLNNGSQILWLHMDDPDVANIIRGLEINWFFGDQAEEIEEEIFDLLIGRLGRWDQAKVPEHIVAEHEQRTGTKWAWTHPVNQTPIPPTYAMLACNPDTDLHWIYNRFHPESPEWQEKWSKRGYKMIFFDSMSNKFLPEQNKQALRDMRSDLARRYVHGLWGIPEGLIHQIPTESIIEFTSHEQAQDWLEHVRQTCTLHRTLDHGESSPTACVWWAVDRDGNSTAFREYYMPNTLVSDHRKNITALSAGEVYQQSLADPAIFNRGTGGQKNGQFWTVADEYSDRINLPRDTALDWIPADNNELGTRNRINEYLRVDPKRIHPVTKQPGAPRLYFVRRNEFYPQGCVHLIRETRAQKRLAVAGAGGVKVWTDERDDDIVDHAYDTLRYHIASRPAVAVEPSPKVRHDSFFAKQQLLARHATQRIRT